MPTSCAECFNVGLWNVFECHLDDVEQGKRPDCPLIEIPDNHGRLIDGDEILEHRYVHMNSAKEKDDKVNLFRCGWNCALESVAEFAPTIVSAEKG